MKKPMDAEIAILMFLGMTRTIRSRRPKTVSSTNTIPEMSVITMAAPKLSAWDWMSAPRMKFEPIPVESAKGKFV